MQKIRDDLESEISSSSPSEPRIKTILESAKKILEGTSSKVAAHGIINGIEKVSSML